MLKKTTVRGTSDHWTSQSHCAMGIQKGIPLKIKHIIKTLCEHKKDPQESFLLKGPISHKRIIGLCELPTQSKRRLNSSF